jgi:hypothetical protein
MIKTFYEICPRLSRYLRRNESLGYAHGPLALNEILYNKENVLYGYLL